MLCRITVFLSCFAFTYILYTKYEITQKYQARQTNVNNNYIIVNKNFTECIINLCRFRFLGGRGPCIYFFPCFKVKAKIEKTCKGEFDQTFLTSLMEWLNDIVLDWMRIILPPQGLNVF